MELTETYPLVSVICGYHNRLENLDNSIKSLLNQTYPNIEFIVFDDCSTDGTREALEVYKDPRLTLVKHKNNLGFTKGMIQAVALARGEYIAIHGAGDESLPERISKQVALLQAKPEVGIVGCLLEDITPTDKRVHTPIINGIAFGFTHGEVMFRRDVYYRTGGYNAIFKVGQFTPLKVELLKYSKSDFVDEVLYRRIHFKNGVTNNDQKKIQQEIYLTLGFRIAEHGILRVNISKIVLEVTLRKIEYLKVGSEDEKNFLFHARNTDLLALAFYRLSRLGLLPLVFVRKYGSLKYKILKL